MSVIIKFDFAEVSRKLGLLSKGLRRGILVAISEWLRLSIRDAFQNQTSPEGVKWKALTPGYAAQKKKGLRILELSGSLFNSADRGLRISDDSVTAASSLPYSAIHQYGGTIHLPDIFPKKKNALRFYIGGRAVFSAKSRAHDVRIPARPYLPSPQFAEVESKKVAEEAIQDLINKAGMSPA